MTTRYDQVKEHLLEIFNTCDTDHNGKIDKKEAKAVMDKMEQAADDNNVLPPRGFMEKIFDELDIDGNGGVDFEECLLGLRSAMPEDLEAFLEEMPTSAFVELLTNMEKTVVAIRTGDFGPLGSDPALWAPDDSYKDY